MVENMAVQNERADIAFIPRLHDNVETGSHENRVPEDALLIAVLADVGVAARFVGRRRTHPVGSKNRLVPAVHDVDDLKWIYVDVVEWMWWIWLVVEVIFQVSMVSRRGSNTGALASP